MTRVTVQLQLPEDMAAEANRRGLLTPQAIEALLRRELRYRRTDRLFEQMQRLHSITPPLTEDELDAEIRVYRAGKRT